MNAGEYKIYMEFNYKIVLALLLFSLIFGQSTSDATKIYFLQKQYDYRHPAYTAGLNMECVHTKPKELISNPAKITICYRSFPMTYQLSSFGDFWLTIFGFGSIKEDFTDMDEGYLFGVWETGPWLAYKGSNNTVHEWVALGENFLHDFQIWRHSCFSIDFEAGKIRLVENGETRHEMNSLELLRPRTINFVSIDYRVLLQVL